MDASKLNLPAIGLCIFVVVVMLEMLAPRAVPRPPVRTDFALQPAVGHAEGFTLGQVRGKKPSECHSGATRPNATDANKGNIVCVFRHACWSSARAGEISVLPRGGSVDGPAPWPEPNPASPPGVGFDLRFALRRTARPDGVVVLVNGATAVAKMFQDHMPHFAEVAFLLAGLLATPDGYGSPPVSHLLLEVAAMQGPDHPREWMRTVLDLLAPSWRAMLFSRDPFLGKTSGMLRPDTALGRWRDPGANGTRVLLTAASPAEAVSLDAHALERLSQRSANYSVCFEELWFAGGMWSFDVAAADSLRTRAHTVLGVPLAAPRHLCVINRRSSRALTNAGEVLDFLTVTSKRRNVRSLIMDGEGPARQIELMSTCALVVSPHGAQLTNAIFMPRGAAVFEVLSWSMGAAIGGGEGYFRRNSEAAGLVHVTVTAAREDLAPRAPGSCGDCWEDAWSGYSDAELANCTKLGGEGGDRCHFCAKRCATRLNVKKYADALTRLIRIADELAAP